jgi:hypothetical protein
MFHPFLSTSLCAVVALGLAGCGRNSSPSSGNMETAGPPATSDAGREHAHESDGPHGGTILELGEYHAELVHDDAAGTVTVYVLDGAAAENVPVDATEAAINLTHDGQGEQFKLAAAPVEGEPAGWSLRFVSSDAELAEELDHAGAAAFVVTINGKPHRGSIEHHEHANEHDHDHAQE